MGLFEWIGESFNPGPVGTVERDVENDWQPRNKFIIWLLTVLGIGMFSFFLWGVLQWNNKWEGVLLLTLYLFLSWFLTPKPDHRNMGWFGGTIDNPFRISDDFNRAQLFFAAFLIPGKIILHSAQTIINTIRAL